MKRVEAWVVVWMACLAAHVLGQLGVVSVDGDKEEERNTIISTDDLLPNKQGKGWEPDDDGDDGKEEEEEEKEDDNNKVSTYI